MMWLAIVRSQWAFSRTTLLFFTVVSFAAPLSAVVFPSMAGGDPAALIFSGEVAGLLVLGAITLASILLAAQSWAIDARVGHIYALSLPIARRRYVVYRILAVCALLSVIAGAVFLGGLAASAIVILPDTLSAYPFALALRALLGAWLIACTTMALRMSAGERLPFVVLAVLVATVLGAFMLNTGMNEPHAWQGLMQFLRSPTGPFGVLLGRWTLIDV
ncbi:MAG: hypothetical protein ABIT38_02065 [Gemmatimonadaceae bacterium]